jgi:hypothetical protein
VFERLGADHGVEGAVAERHPRRIADDEVDTLTADALTRLDELDGVVVEPDGEAPAPRRFDDVPAVAATDI